jgi:hypothetical protein
VLMISNPLAVTDAHPCQFTTTGLLTSKLLEAVTVKVTCHFDVHYDLSSLFAVIFVYLCQAMCAAVEVQYTSIGNRFGGGTLHASAAMVQCDTITQHTHARMPVPLVCAAVYCKRQDSA